MHASAVREIIETAPYPLPPLPYQENALEPYISGNTLSFHHGKHHNKYVSTTNELVKGTQFEQQTLQDIIKATAGSSEQQKLFNNAAQSWNHWFYWNSMTPGGGGRPSGSIAEAIDSSFGSYEQFVSQFTQAATTQFGSGWAWLVKDGDQLKVMKTGNADNPVAHGVTPLLTADVWEHAYYLDYQNRRKDYIQAYVDNLINWDFVGDNMG